MMEKKIYILAATQISLQQPLSEAWMTDPVPTESDYTRCQDPNFREWLNPMESRRMGKIMKRALVTAMKVMKDTGISHAVVEFIYFNTGAVVQHVFDRLRGTWMLTSIQTIPIPQSSNASFLAFYRQFASDSEFQAHSLSESIKFEGPDPDDDFARMEGEITPDTWEAFAPDLPKKMIFNVIYGQPHKEGNRKLFVLRGIANGLELEMTFQRKGGEWKLIKLTT